ncbi:hypothetical protein OESDEN_11946 [Oesophagostomum dentatum]|uniref:Uncharacterized protein n=1 Tax=Oesophagostomum dentatum TaxID=61180 RepID=A0A0B1SSI4_OESDE|nr:hypothetical protein OESDEN_11946 [Oesophagostomum dentatum]
MLRFMRIIFVLAAVMYGVCSSSPSEIDNDSTSIRAKRFLSFNLLKPYAALRDDYPFERPIVLETRDARNRLDCILNLRSFELCRERL